MTTTLRAANRVLRVLLELGALAAFAYWGMRTADGAAAGVRAGGALLAATLLWGAFVAPKSLLAVPPPLKALLALVVFVAAAAALVGAGQVLLGAGFAAAAWLNVTATRLLGRFEVARGRPGARQARRPRH